MWLFEVPSGKLIRTISTPKISEAVFAPDGRTLAIAIENGIHLHDVASGNRLRTLSAHTSSVTALRFTPDGRRLVSTGRDRRLIVWDLATGEPVSTILAHRAAITSLDLSPDGQLAATLGLDNGIKLWHLPTGQHMSEFPINAQWSESRVCFTPDGQTLTVNLPNRLVVFDTR